ncbi:MAG: serine/threonine-protein phosphatase, partial [Chloroflexota bacterium]|nr:serine/threonine-protein phosphatase [Chloroflexota bacterium]
VLCSAVAVDLLYGREASLTVTLVFAPFLASALLSTGDTVVAGASAVAAAFALGWPDGTVGTSAHLVRTSAVFVGASLAVWLAHERTRREAKLSAVSRVAETAQQAILRPLPRRVAGLDLAARYVSATAEARVGGDFYEAIPTPWGVRLVVGDVRGKGLEAVRLASTVLGEFRSRAATEPDLASVVARVDAAAVAASDGEDFATAIFAEITGPIFRLVRCGHPQPMCVGADGLVVELDIPGSLPLGLGGDGSVATTVVVDEEQRLLLYSDGAIETRSDDGSNFDLSASLHRASRLDPDAVLQQVLDDLRDHAGGVIDDDVVLLMAKCAGPAVPVLQHQAPASGSCP